MGLFNTVKGYFANKQDEKDALEARMVNSISELRPKDSFSISACNVLEVSSQDFVVIDVFQYYLSTGSSRSAKVLTVKSIDSQNIYRICELVINGNIKWRVEKEIEHHEVEAVFFDSNWVAQDEDNWVPPSDFRFLFEESLSAAFKLERYNHGDEDIVKSFSDWTASEYRFLDQVAIEGYRNSVATGNQVIQNYFMIDKKKEFSVNVENFEDGVTKVYVGAFIPEFSFEDFVAG